MQLKPIHPFEPIVAAEGRLPAGDRWVAQIKWDGVRMLTYHDGTETRLVNRRLNDRSQQYPEFLEPSGYCSGQSFILDGEFIAMNESRPSFHEIMRRESLRKSDSIARALHQVPVTYMIFDLLYLDGEWVVDRTLEERQRLLRQAVTPTGRVQLVDNVADAEGLFEVMKRHQMEGIVFKDLDSKYLIGGKDGRWQKRKIFHDLLAVVGGVTYNAGTVNALLLGVYQEGRLHYIGHAGTGKLSAADWRQVTERVKGLVRTDKPFANEPERAKDAVWVEPRLVVKVQFMEWTPGGTMRHASIQAFLDAPPEGCTLER